jgi:hypothetical protein
MIEIFIARAKEDGQVGGLIPHLVEEGVLILQYVDKTILFMEHDLEKAANTKLIMCIFVYLYNMWTKPFFIRVRSSILEMRRRRNTSTNTLRVIDVYALLFL